ncbi:hypothetical protein B0T14DRAFT_570620 [Immersiella caudata]|uniref:Uncharacterized protein n=1 Tax=Immersiella caudata TaxID=314043 RepID=A0AA39WG13_9PEZI|nr:hypothetical protein B0T14DRAFT_570620 [Immersiella caudata]
MSASQTTTSEIELSETDNKFLQVAMTCLKNPPEIDIPKLAEKLGIKPKTVSNRWGELRKKLFANDAARASSAAGSSSASGGATAAATAAAPAATPRKRKALAAATEGTKKAARSTKAKKPTQAETIEVAEEEEEDPAEV